MTRMVSGGEIKRGAMFKSGGAPRAGSLLREIYDRLRNGEVVTLGKNKGVKSQLSDVYGMEIASDFRGSWLIGEWDGPYFVPVERLGPSE